MRIPTSVIALLVALVCPAAAQDVRREIHFPDLAGYQTLACDLHMHTVFSDGLVWPTVRVDEAWRQGLDAISLTDHIEYQPHKDDVPTKHNRPFELARGRAQERNLLLIHAAEITRDTPPGHFNALFLDDVQPLDTTDFVEAIKQANHQGAFVFWNHQGWRGAEKGKWLEVHTTLYQNKWFQGMEVCNGDEYYPAAHQWCLDKNLTMLGNSDIHDPDLRIESTATNHRTLNLVFAKQRTLAALKESLLAGRTAVWYKEQLIGRKEWLEPLLRASLRIGPPHHRVKDAVWVEIRNECDADIRLERPGKDKPIVLNLPARSTSVVKIGTVRAEEVRYTAMNWLIAPGVGLPVTLEIPKP